MAPERALRMPQTPQGASAKRRTARRPESLSAVLHHVTEVTAGGGVIERAQVQVREREVVINQSVHKQEPGTHKYRFQGTTHIKLKHKKRRNKKKNKIFPLLNRVPDFLDYFVGKPLFFVTVSFSSECFYFNS